MRQVIGRNLQPMKTSFNDKRQGLAASVLRIDVVRPTRGFLDSYGS
jgi:hypothetical protein